MWVIGLPFMVAKELLALPIFGYLLVRCFCLSILVLSLFYGEFEEDF